MTKNYKIGKHPLGFMHVLEKPSKKDLEEYYSKKYFQDQLSQYSHQYSKEELEYFNNSIQNHYEIISDHLSEKSEKSFLEIGPGEGFALSFFKKKKWKILGLDYSDFGCSSQNPECLENINLGDLDEELDSLLSEKKKFSVIYADHVLEHVIDPVETLEKVKNLLIPDGVLFVAVPNDFSKLQQHLYKNNYISREFWTKPPEHLSYFNYESFGNVCEKVGLEIVDFWSSFPIDLNLFNSDTNYIEKPECGKNCHLARVAIDNFLNNHSRDLALEYYRSLAKLGIGRDMNFYLKKKKESTEESL